MKRQQTFAHIEYANRKRRTKMDDFLETMNAIIERPEWCALVKPYYPKRRARAAAARDRNHTADVTVEAAIIAAPSSTKNEKQERDPEMHSAKKGIGELHIGADAGNGYIHSVEVTAANVSERKVVPDLLREDDEVGYGDAGYVGFEKQESITKHPDFSQIAWRINQRKSYRATEAWRQGKGARWHKIFNAQKTRKCDTAVSRKTKHRRTYRAHSPTSTCSGNRAL